LYKPFDLKALALSATMHYRPFMKAQHLLNLPDAPAAQHIQQQRHWRPSSTAWLNCTWQNWCCYSAQHSHKNTVVFTYLPKGALQEKRCSQDCLVATNINESAAAAGAAHTMCWQQQGVVAVGPVVKPASMCTL
jgi:hypothetical protein